jgi:LacI family transcriptional regulator
MPALKATKPDGRGGRPTIRDVAATAGMSVVTVSRVLNKHPSVKPSSRARVDEAMRALNYHPDAAAQSLRRNSSRIIGFLMPDFTDGVNAVVAQRAERAMREAGYTVMLACSNFDPEVEIEALGKFRSNRVDGIVLQTTDEQHPGILEVLRRIDCPLVLVDRDMDIDADAVLSNHYDATREAVRYLLSLGHRDIGFITPAQSMRPGRERLRGFRDEMADQNIRPGARRVFAEAQSIDYGYRCARQMLSERAPSAIIAAGNQILYGVLQAIREYGLRIPQDISVIGADHRMLSRVMEPKLTMIDREVSDLGSEAATLLLDRIEGWFEGPQRRLLLPLNVVLNGSCRAVERPRPRHLRSKPGNDND